MYFKTRKIKGKEYKYAVKSIRLPNNKIVSLEIRYKNQDKKEINKIFEEKEKSVVFDYVLKKIKPDHIFTKDQIMSIEEIKFHYKKIMKKLPKENIKDLLDRFTANFTYESNALEGNSLTLKDVSIVMFENASIKNKELREIYETRNSRKVVGLIMENKFDVSQKSIIKAHKMLVKDIDIRTGYKKIPNYIEGRDLETTLPENVEKDMRELVNWYNKNKEKMHPIKLASLFHGKFEEIHPFEDGNGRVGRFMINIILVRNKYPPLIVRKSQRIAYLKALENFDRKHTDTLQRFILERFKETYKKFFEIYVRYI